MNMSSDQVVKNIWEVVNLYETYMQYDIASAVEHHRFDPKQKPIKRLLLQLVTDSPQSVINIFAVTLKHVYLMEMIKDLIRIILHQHWFHLY